MCAPRSEVLRVIHEYALLLRVPTMHYAAVAGRAYPNRWAGAHVLALVHHAFGDVSWILDQ